ILGGNLLTHYTHSRDLKYVYSLAAHYNTDEKIMETLALAEAHGINTVSMHNPPHPISVLASIPSSPTSPCRCPRSSPQGLVTGMKCGKPRSRIEPGDMPFVRLGRAVFRLMDPHPGRSNHSWST